MKCLRIMGADNEETESLFVVYLQSDPSIGTCGNQNHH